MKKEKHYSEHNNLSIKIKQSTSVWKNTCIISNIFKYLQSLSGENDYYPRMFIHHNCFFHDNTPPVGPEQAKWLPGSPPLDTHGFRGRAFWSRYGWDQKPSTKTLVSQ